MSCFRYVQLGDTKGSDEPRALSVGREPAIRAADRGRAATRLLDPRDALAVGLAAYVGGFLLKSSATTEPLELVADLLYTFGWALWTGVVVVVFLQVIPEAKRRQFKLALDAYEATLREGAGAGSEEASASTAPE